MKKQSFTHIFLFASALLAHAGSSAHAQQIYFYRWQAPGRSFGEAQQNAANHIFRSNVPQRCGRLHFFIESIVPQYNYDVRRIVPNPIYWPLVIRWGCQ